MDRMQGKLGLSPRVRGNPMLRRKRHHIDGSIPARAGEPVTGFIVQPIGAVYPRACGGTGAAGDLVPGLDGLSPRVRGNLCCSLLSQMSVRSIPARAGEPLASP